jgi:hypothetical protein
MSKVSGVGLKVSSGASARGASHAPRGGGGGSGKGAVASLAASLGSLNASTGKKNSGHLGTHINKYA